MLLKSMEVNKTNNLTCPFCGETATPKSMKNLTIKKTMPLIIEILKKQGFEMRKIRKR